MSDEVARFIYEGGHLKSVPRSGWALAGVAQPESVAEHTYRTALLAAILAHYEGADVGRATVMALVHDLGETRIQDVHLIAKSYLNKDAIEPLVAQDQVRPLPDGLGELFSEMLTEFKNVGTREAAVVHDADVLECLVQGLEYQARGYGACADWVSDCEPRLRTSTGKRLADACRSTDPNDWWRRLQADARARHENGKDG